MELLYPGEWELERGRPVIKVKKIGQEWFLRLEARCASCGRSHLLLDSHFHGWNGLVCHEEKLASLPRPKLTPWICPTCGKSSHGMTVQICCPGKDFVMEESEGQVDESRWADAFSGFAVTVTCEACKGRIDQLVDYETM